MGVNVGLIGFGTVGSGTVKTFLENRDLIDARAGAPVRVTRIADLDITTDRGVDLTGIDLSTDAEALLSDPAIDIVLELVGGTGVARTFVEKALANGKHVVTANKALLAHHGRDLFALAQRHNVSLSFEASVGGAIPIIQSLNGGLASARFEEIYGIINGTSNYILTKMMEGAGSFDQVLAVAQEKGYAEADPSFDVDGQDTAHKIAILASCCFGTAVPIESISVSGIRDVTIADIEYANALGYEVKLLAVAKDHGDEIEIRVHPTFIPQDCLLAPVRNVYNAVYLKGYPFGSVLLSGRGAGDLPTGGAVVSDVIQAARRLGRGVPGFDYANFTRETKRIKAMGELECSYYIRVTTQDRPGVLAQITGVLGRHDISIASFLQRERHEEDSVPIVMMTDQAVEANMQSALAEIADLPVVRTPPFIIRVEHL